MASFKAVKQVAFTGPGMQRKKAPQPQPIIQNSSELWVMETGCGSKLPEPMNPQNLVINTNCHNPFLGGQSFWTFFSCYIPIACWQVFPFLANPLFTPILCIKRFLLLVSLHDNSLVVDHRFSRHDQIRPTSGERSRPESSAQQNQGLQRKRFGNCSGWAATILHGKMGKTSIRGMFLPFFCRKSRYIENRFVSRYF